MSKCQVFNTEYGHQLAYHKTEGRGPTVIFLAGLMSDMEGTKALHLETWCRENNQAFLRFDYSGHGQSSGRFEDGCIGDWQRDTLAIVDALTEGPIVPVGSSMGGWQALLLGRNRPKRMQGLVTIAAAPDFSEDSYWANFSEHEKTQLVLEGQVRVESDYAEPYIISERFIEDGRHHLVLRSPLVLSFPVRCLQGSADTAVEVHTALRLFHHASCHDFRLTLVKGADHRFSDEYCLKLIEEAVQDVSGTGSDDVSD
ncbi:MAG: alpha/beta hydrolase [Aestuariivita sp.]|nr:alpha/beta hydrolase [Aestuariivita sp.]